MPDLTAAFCLRPSLTPAPISRPAIIPPGTAARRPSASCTPGTPDSCWATRLDRPVDAVVCWTCDGGAVTGGTGMGIRIAEAHGIPVLNLGAIPPRTACERLAAIRRAAAAS